MSDPLYNRVAAGSGFSPSTIPQIIEWLQSDGVRDQQIDHVQVGTALFALLGGKTSFKAGPYAFTVAENPNLHPDEIWLMQKVAP